LLRGPPQVLLRVLVAPVLVVSTVVMLATGIVAVLVGHGGIWLGLHKISFIVWGVAFALHVLAHLLELRVVAADWWHSDGLAGRRLRQGLLGASIVVGVGVASLAFPLAHHWHHGF
jgi:hypothetical protein